jgi:hypothetical protein
MVMRKNKAIEQSQFQQFRALLYLFGRFFVSLTVCTG